MVENGSNDGCADFLWPTGLQPAYARPGPSLGATTRPRLARHLKPLGVAGARNRGLRDAQGEVVVFADAHVDVPPGWLPPVARTLNRPVVGLVGPTSAVIGAATHAQWYGQRIAEQQLRVAWLSDRQGEPYPLSRQQRGFRRRL